MFTKISATLVAITAATSSFATTFDDTFTSYFAFGDSLTDDGKLGLPPPYFEGQFSSGPVYAELIAEVFEDAQLATGNFALGGATAGDINTNTNGDLTDGEYPAAIFDDVEPFDTFNSQIDEFTDFFSAPGSLALIGDNPLISVLFGANDIFQGGNPIDAANAVADGLDRLVGLGAQFDDFLVSTLPELGDPADAAGNTIASVFNGVLSGRLSDFAPSINIIDLNQNAFQASFLPRLGELGITNVTVPCLVPGVSDCTIIGVEPDGITPIRDLSIADTYYLIDAVHPSGPVQQAFGEFAIDILQDRLPAPVPLPATLPLLLAGLAGFGLMRRRIAA